MLPQEDCQQKCAHRNKDCVLILSADTECYYYQVFILKLILSAVSNVFQAISAAADAEARRDKRCVLSPVLFFQHCSSHLAYQFIFLVVPGKFLRMLVNITSECY